MITLSEKEEDEYKDEDEEKDCFERGRYRHNSKSKYLQGAHYAPSIDLNALHILIHLMLTIS